MRDGDSVDHFKRSMRNYFSAGGLDRSTLLRPKDQWLEERLADSATRIVPVWRSLTLLRGDSVPRAVLLSPSELRARGFDCGAAVLLGMRAEVAYFALDVLSDEVALGRLIPSGARFCELRDVGPLLDADAGSMLAYARAITYWHARHRHCGDCGAPTRVAEGGHLRVCSDAACGQKHFPRTDPAIIVLVLHQDATGADESRDGRGTSPGTDEVERSRQGLFPTIPCTPAIHGGRMPEPTSPGMDEVERSRMPEPREGGENKERVVEVSTD